jgi:PAS domain S-box-containing protein
MEHANRMESVRAEHLDPLTVLSGTTSYIYMVDRGHRLRYASPNALKNMGLTFEEVEDMRFKDLPIPGSVIGSEDVIQRAFETELPQEGESTYMLPVGRRYFTYDVVPVRNDDGEVDMAVLTARDTTAMRTAELLGEVLNRTNASINSTMSLAEIMERAISISSPVLECDGTAMLTRSGSRWALQVVSGMLIRSSVGSTMTDEEMRSTFLGPQDLPASVPDVEQAGWYDGAAIGRFGIRSFISIPLKVRSTVIGALVFAFSRPRLFPAEEVDFSLKLSTAVSLTLENAELYVHERERRFLLQAILDDIPAVVIDVDGADLKIRWTNRYAQRYSPQRLGKEEVVGKELETIVPQLVTSGIARTFKEVPSTGRPLYDSEFMLVGPGTEATYWRGSVVPLRLGELEVPDLLIMAVEITDQVEARKRAEELSAQALGERERTQTILETLPIGAALIDRTGRVMDMNTAAKNLWAVIRPSFTDLKELDDVQAWSETGTPLRMDDWGVTKAAFRGISTNNEMVTLKRYDGREMVMMMSSAPLLDPSRGVVGAVVIGQDLTNQLQVQKRMVICQEREELYVDLLTHDINNLNASAMGYLQLLRDAAELMEKERGWVNGSLEALEENTRLIESIRGLKALESGVEALDVTDLDRVLRRVIDDSVPHPSREVEIRLTSRGEHCILASPLVEEVFSNLVDNAIRHSDGPLTIWISVSTIFETGREYHRVDVVDDGPGIPERVKDNLFTRAGRGRSKGIGIGLGLFLVRRLVEDLEGRVWVEDRVSGDPEKGAKFVVLLPAVECSEVKTDQSHRS